MTVDDIGTEINLLKTSPSGESTLLATARIWFDTTLKLPSPASLILAKPFCLLSVRNTLEIQMLGEMLPTEPDSRPPQPFLARSAMRLPVGWDCIEIFPGLTPESWTGAGASIWAENDILAAVVAHQFQETHFNTLDPKA